jgi:hypothetical protein
LIPLHVYSFGKRPPTTFGGLSFNWAYASMCQIAIKTSRHKIIF